MDSGMGVIEFLSWLLALAGMALATDRLGKYLRHRAWRNERIQRRLIDTFREKQIARLQAALDDEARRINQSNRQVAA